MSYVYPALKEIVSKVKKILGPENSVPMVGEQVSLKPFYLKCSHQKFCLNLFLVFYNSGGFVIFLHNSFA